MYRWSFINGKNVKLNNITKMKHCSSIHAILAEADKYRGVPYVFGGANSKWLWLSGYVKYVFENEVFLFTAFGSDEQYNVGVEDSRANLKVGDLSRKPMNQVHLTRYLYWWWQSSSAPYFQSWRCSSWSLILAIGVNVTSAQKRVVR